MPDAPEARPKRPIRSVISAGSARSDAECQPVASASFPPVTRCLASHVAGAGPGPGPTARRMCQHPRPAGFRRAHRATSAAQPSVPSLWSIIRAWRRWPGGAPSSQPASMPLMPGPYAVSAGCESWTWVCARRLYSFSASLVVPMAIRPPSVIRPTLPVASVSCIPGLGESSVVFGR